jgi:hypothetical protein
MSSSARSKFEGVAGAGICSRLGESCGPVKTYLTSLVEEFDPSSPAQLDSSLEETSETLSTSPGISGSSGR